jgi:hypothetical protein
MRAHGISGSGVDGQLLCLRRSWREEEVRAAQVPVHGQLHGRWSGRLRKEGGTGRRAATEQLIGSLGSSVEPCYPTFGGDDFVLIADLPGNIQAAAGSAA